MTMCFNFGLGFAFHRTSEDRVLCVNGYTKTYIDQCRSRFLSQISAYAGLVEASGKSPTLRAVIKELEPHYFNNMVLALEACFFHRARGKEGKDGNPLNEVRMLSAALMSSDGRMAVDKTIKYDAANSKLGYKVGDEVTMTETGFKALLPAFLEEIEKRYP